MNKQINTLYFSATGTTETVVTGIAGRIAGNIEKKTTVNNINFTLPEARKKAISFTPNDIVIVGVPVIAGRVPNVLLKFLKTVAGNGALAVGVVVYGNRNYDDALIELKDILVANGFNVIAGGAFIGEHSFSTILAQNRPDKQDMAVIDAFAGQIWKKITAGAELPVVLVNGNRPYRDYYRPKDGNGNPVDIRSVIPKTTSDCIECKLCVSVCPMGSIDAEETARLTGICIKCCACIKKCPAQAKYFDDERYLRHKTELEIQFSSRREPELFI